MKYILISMIFLMGACSGEQEKINIPADLGLELGDLQLVSYNKGKAPDKKVLVFDESEKSNIKTWFESFSELKNKDFNSYVPVMVLQGKQIKVNFQKNMTVISMKENADPKSVWIQYSRVPTEQDRRIQQLLRKVSQKK